MSMDDQVETKRKLEVLEELLARGADFQRQDAARRRAIDYAQTMGAERTSARLASLLATRQ